MKRLIIAFTLFISVNSFAQSAMDKAVTSSCDCITKSKKEVTDYDSYLALIIECASPEVLKNSEALSRELGIDGTDMSAIEEIGSKLGERLVLECPRFMEMTMTVLGEDPELMEQALGDYNDDYEDESELIESGVVISVSKEIPCQVSVKNELGETLNFLWINYIIAPDNFVAKPETLVGKKIDIVYYLDDIFNSKSGEYQSRKILIELTPQK